MVLSEQEKRELRDLARSPQMKEDLRKIAENRYDPFLVDGEVDMDRIVAFLTEYNSFIDHAPKPFRKIMDGNMRL